jgi:four helix bundle protein
MSRQTSQAIELQKRLIAFASGIVDLSTRLPRTLQGRHIAAQILRSGTATAANYGEARGAESRPDFIHKLRVVLKELNETSVWLQLIAESSLISPQTIATIVAENQEPVGLLRHPREPHAVLVDEKFRNFGISN